jgi:mRNA interferase HigB
MWYVNYVVRVIALKRLREFWKAGHADAEGPLRSWYRIAEKASWMHFAEVRQELPSADQVGDKLIFNIAGNKYRLIAVVDYARSGVLIKWIGTHAEYDRLDVQGL